MVSWCGAIQRSTTPRSASSIRSRIYAVDLDLAVIPGISSIQLLAARHKIILNRVGKPIHITTGRRLLDEYSPALGDVVVMLDGDLACSELLDRYGDLTIYWGAQLGLPDEPLIAGQLSGVIKEIRAKRARDPQAPRLGDGHVPPTPVLAGALRGSLSMWSRP